MSQLAHTAAQRFEQIFGHAPTGVWAAPGRVNLIGEHTDYNGGLCLPIALPQRTYAAAGPRDDDIVRVASLDFDEQAEVSLDDVAPGVPGGWLGYVAGTIWALREQGFAVHGLDLATTSDVPIGAGLSSSAAIEGAAGGAASGLFNLGLLDSDASRVTLVDACRRAENHIVGAPTGGLDQTASLRCLPRHALLIDFGHDARVRQIPFDVAAHGLRLLVIDTRAKHALVDGQYAARRANCEQAARELGVDLLGRITPEQLPDALSRLSDQTLRRRVRHVVTEIARTRQCCDALEHGNFQQVGELFNQSHASLRDDYEVSSPELDLAVAAARGAGALGARMTGGGFGGSAIALVPVTALDAVKRAVADAYLARGWTPAHVFAVHAAGPADRVAVHEAQLVE
ncbi:galactokinase [Propionibacterium freudenreichii]|uniref:galactokinase n=1 Tax=Propionibacterium freudenreichii TaxID=1744 RepID=UPI000BC2C580|nr:galactokinase [Propionibacterium freudenreichii]MDN5984382.1 galactokinase [Propionibacterium sp.]MCT2980699.1 galactokinase [Propionibacterium freudenreichii]MCT2991893.1 galactokinase [Propionibacterium freudenreichii]MCT2993553.1 galactokinase [Propionibacterium freudenreichii]MDK9294904.1 galactokinase [Propionibacterium freudenreichii]